jgi:hypothetical protein
MLLWITEKGQKNIPSEKTISELSVNPLSWISSRKLRVKNESVLEDN